jgi:heme oxygenase (biliverdin-IX-beta and delta-forming)
LAIRKKPLSARPATTLTERLRAETRDLHEAIEAHPAFARLTRPQLTRQDYAAHLSRLFGFYEPAERRLAAHAADPDLALGDRLVKTGRLGADLSALGWDEPAIRALPRWPGRDLSSLEAAWGYVYVMEGSTLGGRVIAGMVARHLGADTASGLSFLQTYGEEAGRMWRDFKTATIQAEQDGRLDPDAVVEGARVCFRDLSDWFDAAA